MNSTSTPYIPHANINSQRFLHPDVNIKLFLKKHMKNCSTALVICERKLKPQLQRMTKVINTNDTKYSKKKLHSN